MKVAGLVSKVLDFFKTIPSTFTILLMMCFWTYVALRDFRRLEWSAVFVDVMAGFIFFAWGVLVRLDRIRNAVKPD